MDEDNPLRGDPRSGSSIRGMRPGRKAGSVATFRSALERDLYVLLEFDSAVESYRPQPFAIRYTDNAVERRYTPDTLIRFAADCLPPVVAEVKYRDFLVAPAHKRDLRRLCRAAVDYTRASGDRFRILTEREIRQPVLESARFLSRFVALNPQTALQRELISVVEKKPGTAVRDILGHRALREFSRSDALQAIWHLVATCVMWTSLTERLTLASRLRTVPTIEDETSRMPITAAIYPRVFNRPVALVRRHLSEPFSRRWAAP